MSYSEDLRKKVIGYLRRGNSQREAARVFGINLSTVSEWQKKYQETGDLRNKPLNRTFKKIDPEKIRQYMKANPDAYLKEIGDEFGCSDTAVQKALKRLGLTRKKKQSDTANKNLKK